MNEYNIVTFHHNLVCLLHITNFDSWCILLFPCIMNTFRALIVSCNSSHEMRHIIWGSVVFLHKVLWILPYEWLRWCSIVVALFLSCSVLEMTFWPAVRDDHPRVIIAVMSAIVVLNVLLAVGCKVIVLAIFMLLLHNFTVRINYKFERYGK